MTSNCDRCYTAITGAGNVFLPNLSQLENLANLMGFEINELIKEFDLNITSQQDVDHAVAFLTRAHKQQRKFQGFLKTITAGFPNDHQLTERGK